MDRTEAQWDEWLRRFVLRYPVRFHEDLMQEARLGLLTAKRRYKQGEASFTTYATHFVEGSLRHFMRDRAQTIRIASRAYYSGFRVGCVSNESEGASGECSYLLDYYENLSVWDDAASSTAGFETNVILSIQVRKALAPLTPRQREVIWMFAVEGRDLSEIARILNIAPNYACHIYWKGVGRLTNLLAWEGLRFEPPTKRKKTVATNG